MKRSTNTKRIMRRVRALLDRYVYQSVMSCGRSEEVLRAEEVRTRMEVFLEEELAKLELNGGAK